jgi:hypothetical protein
MRNMCCVEKIDDISFFLSFFISIEDILLYTIRPLNPQINIIHRKSDGWGGWGGGGLERKTEEYF